MSKLHHAKSKGTFFTLLQNADNSSVPSSECTPLICWHLSFKLRYMSGVWWRNFIVLKHEFLLICSYVADGVCDIAKTSGSPFVGLYPLSYKLSASTERNVGILMDTWLLSLPSGNRSFVYV